MEKIIAFIISLLSLTVGIVGCQETPNDFIEADSISVECSKIFVQSKDDESENKIFESEAESLESNEITEEFYSSEESQGFAGGGIVLPDIEL